MNFGFPIRLPGFQRQIASMDDFVGSDFPTFAMLHTLFHPAVLETYDGRIGWLPATISCTHANPFSDPNGFRCIIVHRKQIMRLTTHLYKKKVIQAWSIDSLQRQSGSWRPYLNEIQSELSPIIRLWGLEAENETSFIFVPIEFILFIKSWCVQRDNRLLSLKETCMLRNIHPPADFDLGERKLKLSHFHIKNYSHTRGLLGKRLDPETVAIFRFVMEIIRGSSLPNNMHLCGMLGSPEQERFLKRRKNAAVKSTARKVNHVHLFPVVKEEIKQIPPSEETPPPPEKKIKVEIIETKEKIVDIPIIVENPQIPKIWECASTVLNISAYSRPPRTISGEFPCEFSILF